MDTSRRVISLVLIVIALALLYPGVTQPVLTLTGSIEKSRVAELGVELLAGDDASDQTRNMLSSFSRFLGLDKLEGQVEAYRSTRSIWATVSELGRTGNLAVAFLIVFFSLVIPVFKLLLQAAALMLNHSQLRRWLVAINAALSKWSMADVFVMALLVAFMAGRASGQMGDLLIMQASLEPGFYFFLAYCLFSIIATSLIPREPVHV